MAGETKQEPKVWKTGNVVVSEFGLKQIEKNLENKKKELEQLLSYIRKLETNVENVTNDSIDEMAIWVCEVVGNCFKCPLAERCNFRINACEEISDCHSCPRLPVCVWERNAGIKYYITESDEQ